MRSEKTFIQLVNQCLEERSTINKHSRECYRYSIMSFVRYLQNNAVDPLNPTRAEVNLYVNHLEQARLTANTINQYIQPVKIFFEWLEAEGVYENLADRLKLKRKGYDSKKVFLDPIQVEHLLNTIDRNQVVGLRDYAIINLMVRTGIRCCEVSRLDMQDLVPQTQGPNYNLYLRRKGSFSKDARILVDCDIVDPILFYRNHISDSIAPMFVIESYHHNADRLEPYSVSRAVNSRMVRSGLKHPGMTPHSLRHTAASLAMKAGANAIEIQVLLGHKRLSTTEIYLNALRATEEKSYSAVCRINESLSTAKKT